jgi:manganese transport protein
MTGQRIGWKRFLSFVGPGAMVSVGYMDPGNWSTDLAGGSVFGYKLLWVILASNLMAILLQALCVRLGLVTGKDLAEACRDYLNKPTAIFLWVLCELAIIACDIAEVLGSAIALKMLFGIPLVAGVLITGLDVLLLLALTRYGFRMLEAVVITLISTIFICFAINLWLAKPDWAAAAAGAITPSIPNKEALAITVGILGATVMPHNLYLHSSIVKKQCTAGFSLKERVKLATLDSTLSLALAFFVNASILILSASVFHGGAGVSELEDAHRLLGPVLGGASATLFAVALLCSGQSSTITGTLAGQIVMEGFLRLKISPVMRRLITRGLAIIPAIAIITISGGKDTNFLIVTTQIVLSLQLPFAILPLVVFTSSRKKMGEFASPKWMVAVASVIAAVIIGLNLNLIYGLDWSLGRPVAVVVGILIAWTLWILLRGRSKGEGDTLAA